MKRTRVVGAVALLVLALNACSSPQDRYAHHMARGEEFLKAGDFVKASLEFRNALQIQPASVEANYDLGLVFEKLGDLQKARSAFGKAIDQNAKFVPALLHEGQIDLVAADYDLAFKNAEAALSVDPGNAEAHALRGAALLYKGDLRTAEAEAMTSLREQAENAAGVALLAGVRVRQGRQDDAVGLLKDGIKANPQDVGLKLTLFRVYASIPDNAAAEALLENLVDQFPSVAGYRLELAKRLIAGKKLDDAEKLLRAGVEAAPQDQSMVLALVEFLQKFRGFSAAEHELAMHVNKSPKQFAYKFALAELYFANGKHADAGRVLNDIVATNKDDENGLAAQVALARLAASERRTQDAQALLNHILAVDSDNDGALELRATLEIERGDYQSAINDLRSVLHGAPNSKSAMAMLARAYIANGEPELGREFFQRAVNIDPADLGLRVEYSRELTAAELYGEAERQLAEALKQSPNFTPALFARVSLLATQKRWAEAETSARALLANAETAGNGHALLGKVLLAEGRYPDAIAELKTASDALPQSADVRASLASAYIGSGSAAAATSFVQSLIAQNPKDAGAYALMGDVKARLGAVPEARDNYQKSIDLDPSQAAPRLKLGDLFARGGDYAAAKEVLQAGVKALPKDVDLRLQLAIAEDRLDEFPAAKADYEQVLSLRPRQVVATNNLAQLIADGWPGDKQLLDQARKLAEVNRNSTTPALIDTLGWVEYRLGNLDDAVALLERAVSMGTQDPQIHYHLGLAYLARANKTGALAELKLATARPTPYRGLDEARKALAQQLN